MSDVSSNEAWQVEVHGQVYDARFSELADWISEGSVRPDDKVRRGNLRWIEAKKVPALGVLFDREVQNSVSAKVLVQTIRGDEGKEKLNDVAQCFGSSNALNKRDEPVTITHRDQLSHRVCEVRSPKTPSQEYCRNHQDREARFVCPTCSGGMCRGCVQGFGSSVTICQACGGMCKPIREFEQELHRAEFLSSSKESGFGFNDFFAALVYPLQFKTSLFFGALMYMFFSLGKLATSFGGIYMIIGSIFSIMLANMLVFGILSNTVDNFAHGKIGGDFMPAFEDFSLWDDIVHPFFLSIGVYVSSFGPFLLVFAVGSYIVINSVTSQMETVKANLEKTPGTPYYSVRDTFDQSKEVKDILSKTEEINQEHLSTHDQVVSGQAPLTVEQGQQNDQRIDQMIAESKRKELEAVVGKSAETSELESSAFIAALLKLAAPIMVIGFIAFLWGCFYFPAACMVAGYTQTFAETINPLVGLDAVKRLGLDYFKILLMSFSLILGFGMFSFAISLVFNAFDMPGIGNLPARAFDSIVWFYLAIVFSCLIGFAMFKRSDSLRLVRS